MEPAVKMANPNLHRRTRPSMSEIRPKVTSRAAATMKCPKRSQIRHWNGVRGLMSLPREMAGREIRTTGLSVDALRTPRVVFDRAIHVYWTKGSQQLSQAANGLAIQESAIAGAF